MSIFVFEQPTRLYIFTFNVMAMILGIGLAGVVLFDLNSSSRFLLESNTATWPLAILSLLIILVSLLGCSAAMSSSKLVLGIYGIVVALLALFQVSDIIYAITLHDKVDDILNKAWQNAYDNDPRVLQDLETRLGCCGYATIGDRAIPKSSRYACRESPAFGYSVPCRATLKEAYLHHENMYLGFVSAIQFLQLIALAATVALWTQLPRDEETEEQYRAEHSGRLLRGLREEDNMHRRPQNLGPHGEDRAQYGSTDR
ncbi:hypothetical protein BGZ99_007082 [Dissophora globulifera]|uniref:Tetraspanin n=1 Tax=Dissophora globulifera TaxID=979702 RepID=A0A9P6RVA9_9FUNG|nr:hypothetical protein BGZ99_007082 [Dissophora globulifera]